MLTLKQISTFVQAVFKENTVSKKVGRTVHYLYAHSKILT